MRNYAKYAGLLALTAAPLLGFAAPASASAVSGNINSTVYAGYGQPQSPAGNGTLSATFVVPKVRCPKNGTTYGMAPSAYLFTSDGKATGGTVFILCTNDSITYFGLVDVEGTSSVTSFTPAAGDRVKVTASQTAKKSTATFDDLTQTKTQTENGAGGSVDQPFVGEDSLSSNGSTELVPTFTTERFSQCQFDHHTLTMATPYNLTDSGGGVEISTSALNSAGTGFVETFVSNS